MGRSFDSLANDVPRRDNLRIKVRVVHVWEVPSFINPRQINSLEMDLVDEKVCVQFIRVVLVYIKDLFDCL